MINILLNTLLDKTNYDNKTSNIINIDFGYLKKINIS